VSIDTSNWLRQWTVATTSKQTKKPFRGRGQGHVTHSFNLGHSCLCLEQIKLETSNLVCGSWQILAILE